MFSNQKLPEKIKKSILILIFRSPKNKKLKKIMQRKLENRKNKTFFFQFYVILF